MQIPEGYPEFRDLSPEQIQQLCDEMAERPLDNSNIEKWLEDFGRLAALFQECMARLDIATDVNTADEGARERRAHYRETIWPIGHHMEQKIHERMQAHADLMPTVLREVESRWAHGLNQSQAAIDLLNREAELVSQYDQIIGRQTSQPEDKTLPDRARREHAWRAVRNRHWQDRDSISPIWSELIDTRQKLAQINGFDDYLAYRWAEQGRADYTPEDSRALHASLLKHWSPLHLTIVNAQKEALQIESMRPWDPDTTPAYEQLRPFESPDELLQKTLNVFRQVDPEFSAYVEKLRDMGFIDLAERDHTVSAGGFSRAIGRHGNFIFMNIKRTPSEFIGLIHEIGHAFAHYAACKLPYLPLWILPTDFIETPSCAMEILTQPYWGEFFKPEDLQLVRHEYFRGAVSGGLFIPAVDAFQHWVYGNPDAARDPDACDERWHDSINQYLPGIDYTGIEKLHGMDWQRFGLNFRQPLYMMEYLYGRIAGLKLLTLPEHEALNRYKAAISLGNSVSIKGLFAALGVVFPFTDEDVLAAAQTLAAQLS